MKPLESIYRIFILLLLCPIDKSIDRWIKIRKMALLILNVSSTLPLFAASVAFIIKNHQIDLPNSVFAFMQIMGLCQIIYTMIAAHVMCDDIRKVFDDFQYIYDTCKFIRFDLIFTKKIIINWIFFEIR